MEVAGNIILTNSQCLIVLMVCIYLIYRTYLEVILGFYLVLISFSRTVMFGPIALFWVLALCIIICTIFIFIKNNDVISFGKIKNNWIIIITVLWWIWTLYILVLFQPVHLDAKLRNLILYIMLPIIPSMIIVKDLKRMNRFAMTFMLAACLNGLLIIYLPYKINYDTSIALYARRTNLQDYLFNYHRIAVCFGVSIILAVTAILLNKKIIKKIFISSILVFLIYIIYNIGSRQMVLAIILSLFVFFILNFKSDKQHSVVFYVVLFLVIISTAVYLYRSNPEIIVRGNPLFFIENFIDDFNIRYLLWSEGLSGFIESPLFGNGYLYNAHNIFINVLVNQGVLGGFFLIIFLILIFKQVFSALKMKMKRDYKMWIHGLSSIIVFELTRAQFTGDSLSVWHLYWATIMVVNIYFIEYKQIKSDENVKMLS